LPPFAACRPPTEDWTRVSTTSAVAGGAQISNFIGLKSDNPVRMQKFQVRNFYAAPVIFASQNTCKKPNWTIY
jgi:hypothetical protein